MALHSKIAAKRLMAEYQALAVSAPYGITGGPLPKLGPPGKEEDEKTGKQKVEDEDLFHWECYMYGPKDTPFEDGIFIVQFNFPQDYPLSPPTMKFINEIWHPNVYPSGLVCISILHPPGDDPLGYERAEERWSPVQSVEKVLISVMSMLAEPNDESPANVEAAVMWRERRSEYEKIVRSMVRQSLGKPPREDS